MIKFIIAIATFILTCILLEFFWTKTFPPDLQLKTGFLLLGVISGMVLLFHLLLVTGEKSKPSAFINRFMLVSTLKFFAYILLIVVLFFFAEENPRALIAHFLVYYIGLTVIDSGFLYSMLNEGKS